MAKITLKLEINGATAFLLERALDPRCGSRMRKHEDDYTDDPRPKTKESELLSALAWARNPEEDIVVSELVVEESSLPRK